MSNPGDETVLAEARRALDRPLEFGQFLARLPAKDRVNAERRVGVLEAGPDPRPAGVWRRLACTLSALAPHAAKLVGRQTVQFYIADGKYRMQVFALEDLQDGLFTVFCPDALGEAVAAGLLAPPHAGGTGYVIRSTGEPLAVESLDAASLNPAAHFKDLTGWNRKALRITLPSSPSPEQLEATELLCALAARQFPPVPPPSDVPTRKA